MPETITLAQYQELSKFVDIDRWPRLFQDRHIGRNEAVHLMTAFENEANTAFDVSANNEGSNQ